MHPSLKIFNNSVFDFINKDFEIENIENNCIFTEGPVWNAEGYYLFSDIAANCIYKIYPDGGKEVFLQASGTKNPLDPDLKPDQIGSNALAYNNEKKLIACRHGSHDVAMYEEDKLKSFISTYRGKPFNSPNDLILSDNGKIYFSDPPYGLKDGKLNTEKFQPLAGVYCWQNNEVQLICDKYQYPNGVCLSADQQTLYICSNKAFEKFICTYNTSTNQFIKIFAEENSDGIETDKYGNVYLCSKEGLIILNSKGERSALIELPAIASNICPGGKEMNDLFITARQNIFLIKNFFKD